MWEPFDLAFERGALVAQDDPGGEDGQESGPAGEGGEREYQQRAGQGAQRIQALAGQRHPAGEPQQRQSTRHPGRRADRHLEQEFAADTPECGRGQPARAEQAGHQGDPDRVVRTGFALQDGAAAAVHLPLAEHREHHRRIGRRYRRGHQHRDIPGQAERQVREDRGGRHRQERAEHADRADGGKQKTGTGTSRCACRHRTKCTPARP